MRGKPSITDLLSTANPTLSTHNSVSNGKITFPAVNSVSGSFENGDLEVFTWTVKVETGNVMLNVTNVDETLGFVEVGRVVDEIGGTAKGGVIIGITTHTSGVGTATPSSEDLATIQSLSSK